MNWKIEYTNTALKALKKLDKPIAKQLTTFIEDEIAKLDSPREKGKALVNSNIWRWRKGNYRILAEIEDEEIKILVVKIGHRKQIYK